MSDPSDYHTMTQQFTIRIPSDFELTVEDIWPDGDAPENPTPEDVKKVIKEAGGIVTILRDWDLLDRTDFEVLDTTPPPKLQEALRKLLPDGWDDPRQEPHD